MKRRFHAAALIVALSWSTPAHAEPEARAQAQQIHDRAQTLYDAGNFPDAAQAWESMLEVLPENEDNRVARGAAVANALQARRMALRWDVNEQGHQKIEHLEQGQAVFADYQAQLRATYGEDVEVDAQVRERLDLLEASWEDPKLEPCLAPVPDPDPPPCLAMHPCLNVTQPPRGGCGGRNSDLAVLPLLVVPALRRRRRRELLDALSDRLPPDVVARLRERDDTDDD